MMRMHGLFFLGAVDLELDDLLHIRPQLPQTKFYVRRESLSRASSRNTFSAVRGRSRMRTPTALYTALPIAAMTGGSSVSPIPWRSSDSACSTACGFKLNGISSNEGML